MAKFTIIENAETNMLHIDVHRTGLIALKAELMKRNRQEIINEARRMSNEEGVNISALSRKFGCRYQNICYILKKNGISISRKIINDNDGTKA